MFLILFIIFLTGDGSAETYKWVDGKGAAHYTDDLTQIPEKYRSAVKKVEGEETAEPAKKEAESPPKNKMASPADRLGRGEEYWKGRVDELKKKIKASEEKNETLRLKYNELTTRYNDSKSSVERANLRVERDRVKLEMDRNKAEVEEARIVLEKKIPEEAEFFKARPDWIK